MKAQTQVELDSVNEVARQFPTRTTNISNPVFPPSEVLELTSASIKYCQNASANLHELANLMTKEAWSGSLKKPETSCVKDVSLSVAVEKTYADKVHTSIVQNAKRAEGALTKVYTDLIKARGALCRLRSRIYHDLPAYCSREPPAIIDLQSRRDAIPNMLVDGTMRYGTAYPFLKVGLFRVLCVLAVL